MSRSTSSSSNNATSQHSQYTTASGSTTLPTTSTYLPIITDLLSPDFRPVMYPPVITPLQTPTTNPLAGGGSNILVGGINASCGPVANVGGGGDGASQRSGSNSGVVMNGGGSEEAALKIQKWWKKNNNGVSSADEDGGGQEEDDSGKVDHVKHSIRHKRADDHIRHLETELSRLKSSLTAERKLRSLQYEAIRSLWSQVQKLSINNSSNNPITTTDSAISPGIMSQSCPNVLPLTAVAVSTSSPPVNQQITQSSCTCSSEIKELKVKIEREVGELKGLVGLLILRNDDKKASGGVQGDVVLNPVLDDKCKEDEEEDNKGASSMKRPDTLDLNNGSKSQHHATATGEELQGYADDMAKYVVERGLSDNNNSNVGSNDEKVEGSGESGEKKE